MTENCKNCIHFDPSKHANDPRTQHAGICTKWIEVTFKNDTCKHHFRADNLPVEKIFSNQPEQIKQLSLF